MKSKFLIFIVLTAIHINVFSQQKTNVPRQNTYVSSLKKEIQEANRNLPQKYKNDIWLWSQQFVNNTIVITIKIDGIYLSSTNKGIFSNMSAEYGRNMAKTLGKDVDQWIANKLSLKIRYLSYKDNSVLHEITLSGNEIKRFQSYNLAYSGHRSLSYYKDGYESQNSSLPQKLNDDITLVKVEMKDNIIYFDNNITDEYARMIELDPTVRLVMKKEIIEELKDLLNIGSSEFKEDLATYNITYNYRFFSQTTKKLVLSIPINWKELK